MNGVKLASMPVLKPYAALLGLSLMAGLYGPAASAACVTATNATACDTSPPSPWTSTVGQGPNTPSGASLTLAPNAQIVTGNASAVSLGDNATVSVGAGALLQNKSTGAAGLFNAGANTVEFGSNGTMTINAGATVKSAGTANSAEAINVIGTGNTIVNYGLISGVNAAAIWFQDVTVGTPNVIDNHGVIQTGNGTSTANVIGNSGKGNVTFINRTGATVEGSLSFASGNDSLTLEAGSVITGSFNGGGGTNSLTLAGTSGSSDSLPGNISNFQTLIKSGDGTWTLSGTVGNNAGTALAVDVQQGTLALTGNNASFKGSVQVDPAGTLQARAQSLPPSVTDNGRVLFAQPDDGTYAGQIKGTGSVTKTGAGVLTLSGINSYQGNTLIQGGTVAIAADSGLGAANGAVTIDGAALEFTNSFALSSSRAVTLTANNGTIIADAGATGSIAQAIGGAGALTKDGAGTLVLTNANAYSGATTIAAGTLQLGSGGTSGSVPGTSITDNGTLAFDRSDTVSFSQSISGTGGVTQNGSGPTILTANNTYAGATNVNSGALYVDGSQSGTGAASIGSGATLGGTGKLGGSVTVAAGGTLAPGDAGPAPGTLSIGGSLALSANSALSYSFGQAGQVGGPLNDLTEVGGDLALGGTLNVTASQGGTFAPGLYRVIDYAGALQGGSLALGAVPTPGNYFVQTSIAHQVNLINTAGLTLNYWDGENPAQKNNGAIDGGTGVWTSSLGNDNWTSQTGALNAPFSDGAFAVFTGAPGAVIVSNVLGAVRVAGMQFGVNGYTVVGDPVTLTGGATATTGSTIRVGDGTAAGAADTATILAPLQGSATLVKSDLGTLVLGGVNTYTGGTQIDGGTLQVSQDANLGASTGALGLDGGALHTTQSFVTSRALTLGAGGGTFNADAGTTFTASGDIGGAGGLTKTGAGTVVIAGHAVHGGGTTIGAGTLQVGNGGAAGSLSGDVTDNGVLAFDRSDAYTFGGTVSGSGALQQMGTGATVLTANSTYGGGTSIGAGTLQLGNGGTSGGIAGNVANNGTLAFDRANSLSVDGTISGTGNVVQNGAGATTLTGTNSYAGATTVNAGGLFIDGNQAQATGTTTVAAAGTLGGTGTIGGNVVILGGTLAPGGNTSVPGTLTINGSLAIAPASTLAYSFGQASVVGGAFNDLTNVAGDVALNSTLNVSLAPGGRFDPGIYRVINYGGALVGGGTLALGAVPSGSFSVQTSVTHQVNLVDSTGLTLNYWDGDAGPKNDGAVNGGNGAWRAAGAVANDNWTGQNGALNAPWSAGGFAIFTATPGTVTVDSSASTGNGPVSASGMQFAVDGYTINGNTPADAITLAGSGGATLVRVGDGSQAGAGIIAIVDAQLTGASQLVKSDLGTLVLGGNNTYTGGTSVRGGVLQISADNNLGAAGSALTLDGGTLRTSATFTSARPTTLGAQGGTIDVQSGTAFTLDGVTGGSGSLTKTDGGTLVLTQNNAYTGGTVISGGTLQLGAGGASGAVVGNVADNGTLAFARSNTATFAGEISGSGNVAQSGAGTTVLTGANTYAGGTVISAGTLQLGDGGTSGSIAGDVTDNGALAFDRADSVIFSGAISGAGSVSQNGTGTTILTAANTYTGATTINAGTLQLGNGGTSGSIAGNVTDNAALVFNRTDTSSFAGTISGSGFVRQAGTGTTILTADNTYSGGTFIDSGTLQLGDGGTSGSIAGDVTNGGTLAVNRADTVTLSGSIIGSGAFIQQGAGTTILSGNDTYSGGTTIAGGTLQLGNGGASGSIAGDVLDNGTLAFNRADSYAFNGTITGSGGVLQQGSGTTALGRANTYAGPTTVASGTLLIDGDQHAAAGAVNVGNGATLGGIGLIGGVTTVAGGGTLSPGDAGSTPGTLTFGGDLNLDAGAHLSYDFGQADVIGGPLNDLAVVKGNLTLAGTIDVKAAQGGTFAPGLYRVIDYTGALTNNGLSIGTIPSPDFSVQTSVANQVNLVNTAGLTLNFWDGAAGPANNFTVDGGNGVWQSQRGNGNWTTSSGAVNAPWSNGAFAIFMAKPGTVTVDGSLGAVSASGMQFASDGYVVRGEPLTLVADPAADGAATIRVGDGTSPGARYTATIDAVLTGTAQLVKSDLGTLVLNGANTYTGGTAIDGGTLQIASDAALGAQGSALSLNGGTLRSTASFDVARPTTLGDMGGTFDTTDGTQLTASGTIGGTGGLTKTGNGALILTGDNVYAGGTRIVAGVLQLGNGGASGGVAGDIRNDATLAFDRTDRLTLTGAISGFGNVIQQGTGTTILDDINPYEGTTTVSAGALIIGDGAHANAALTGGGDTTVQPGATLGGYGSVVGNVLNAGTIAAGNAVPASTGTPASAAAPGNFTIAGNLVNAGLVKLGGSSVGNTLSVAGNYVGQQGGLAINTKLGADDSPTDRLIVSGGVASGTTRIGVTNVQGAGAQTVSNGIEVVQVVNGATTAPGAFTGASVSAGAYTYMLFRGGVTPGTGDNWYLRSALMPTPPASTPPVSTPPTSQPPTSQPVTDQPPVNSPAGAPAPSQSPIPLYRPAVPVYAEVPSLQRELMIQQIGTFHDRMGAQDLLTENGTLPAAWGRLWGDHLAYDRTGTVNQSFSGTAMGAQAGQDVHADTTASGHRNHYGFFIGYARASGDVNGFALGQPDYAAGHLAIDSYSAGAYWTHIGPRGWYTDLVLMGSTMTIHPESSAGDRTSTHADALTISFESGFPVALPHNLTLELQKQLIYQHTHIDDLNDGVSTVSWRSANEVIGRLGMRLTGQYSGMGMRWQPYGRLDVLRYFGGTDTTTFAQTTNIDSSAASTQGHAGLGVTARVNDRVSVYATAGYWFNLGGSHHAIAEGNAGVRIGW